MNHDPTMLPLFTRESIGWQFQYGGFCTIFNVNMNFIWINRRSINNGRRYRGFVETQRIFGQFQHVIISGFVDEPKWFADKIMFTFNAK